MKGRRRLTALLLILLLIEVFGDTGVTREVPGVFVVSAAPSTQQQIDEAEQRKEELESGQKENEEELNDLKGEQKDLKRELDNLNKELTQVVENLEELERQIKDKEQEIAETQKALEEARAKEKWQYECMVLRVRDMYERKEESYITVLLREKSLADILNTADYIERIAEYERKMMDEFKAIRIYIEEEEERLQTEKIELDNLKVQAEAEKNKVSGLIGQTSNSIAKYGDQIEEAEKKAKEYEAKIKAEEENLETLKKKLAEEMALSQAAANAKWRDISEVTFTEQDRYLLANLIYCEAGGEPYEGQLAVGSVVINRVLSEKFPNTVVGVIYQKRQFSPVASGRLELALSVNKATANCYRAADEAMSGVTNVGNCLFFRTPIPGLTGINIGGHVFY